MPPSHRQVKKRLYQFLRCQLGLSKGDRGEVYQFRPRQVLRRGPLPNLALHTLAKQGVRYLILLHFTNFVSVYFADPRGTIVNVKNFDRKRDHQALKELPTLAKRILEYPKPAKVPPKHEQLLRKTKALQQQFRAKIRAIEQLVGGHLPPRKIPGIALTAQVQEGVIRIPAKIRTRAQLDRFFTTEAFRLFIPAPFHPHAVLLARVLTYLWVDDPADRTDLATQFPEAITQMVRQLPPKGTLRRMIRPLVAVLRLWTRHDDRALPPDAIHHLIAQVIAEFSHTPARHPMEVAATASEALFHRQGDARDLLRLTCFLILSEKHTLIREYRNHKAFQQHTEIARFCHAMLTLRFRQLYPEKCKIFKQFSGPKLSRLATLAFDQLQTWILRIDRATDHLTLVNQSDLDLIDVVFRRLGAAPENTFATIPQLDADSVIDIPLNQNLGIEQLVVEFKDSFGNHYRIIV